MRAVAPRPCLQVRAARMAVAATPTNARLAPSIGACVSTRDAECGAQPQRAFGGACVGVMAAAGQRGLQPNNCTS